MSTYLMRYKGTYRLLPELDKSTNDFVRDANGDINDDDMYIACRSGIKVYAFGHEPDNKITYWLTAYIPSIKKGHMTINALKDNGVEIRRIIETDAEIMFNFKAKDIDKVMEEITPITLGKNMSPHSTKNLPKSNYKIPKESMDDYLSIIKEYVGDDLISIKRATDMFLSKNVKRFLKQSDKGANVVEDMRRKCMSRMKKEYIHSLGLWDTYLAFLKKEFKKTNNKTAILLGKTDD